ncbi:hypothetical protein, partial [Staphylococcus pasteuri]|uniref:hypothetical protein n=1 Tax=Staphylococcus pasteuri TaxID=45972 RepID=UPI001C9997E3
EAILLGTPSDQAQLFTPLIQPHQSQLQKIPKYYHFIQLQPPPFYQHLIHPQLITHTQTLHQIYNPLIQPPKTP